MRKLSKMERFLRWLDRHMVKVVMGIMIIFLFVKVIQANNQRFQYQMKMIEATEKYNEMNKDWSQCYSDKADQVYFKTKCDNELYDLRSWLNKCKCKCTGFSD